MPIYLVFNSMISLLLCSVCISHSLENCTEMFLFILVRFTFRDLCTCVHFFGFGGHSRWLHVHYCHSALSGAAVIILHKYILKEMMTFLITQRGAGK